MTRLPEHPLRLMWGDYLLEDGGMLTRRNIAAARAIIAVRPDVSLDHLPVGESGE